MGHRQPEDEPCAVERHGEHVQGRGDSDCGSSLAGRTMASNNLNKHPAPCRAWHPHATTIVDRRGRDTPPRVPLRPTPRSKTRELTAPHAKTAKLWPGHILRLQSLPRSKTHKTPKRRRQAARGEILGASLDPDDLFSCPGSAQMDAWAYLHCTPAFLTYDTHFSDTLRTSQSALSANFWLRSFTCHKSGTYYFPSKCQNLQKKRQVSSPDLQNTQIPKRILL